MEEYHLIVSCNKSEWDAYGCVSPAVINSPILYVKTRGLCAALLFVYLNCV